MMEYQRLGRVSPHENGKNLKYTLPGGPPVGQKCEHCESGFHMGGPIWLDPIHDQLFVAQLLQSIQVSINERYLCNICYTPYVINRTAFLPPRKECSPVKYRKSANFFTFVYTENAHFIY